MALRIWLENQLTQEYLPFLQSLKDSNANRKKLIGFTQSLRNAWSERGLVSLAQQYGCMAQVRKAIKDALGDTHFSLDVIDFTREEYVQLNDFLQNKVAQRNERVRFLDNPDAIVSAAVRLLDSPEWADLAAALAVLTGRRAAELLHTASFTKKTQWSVLFTGAVKRRGEPETLTFEIPTLTTAKRVCTALDKLRQALPIEPDVPPREINQRYEAAVVKACNKHFSGLVPLREGRDNLYTHLFRSVYACIATFWYCPPTVESNEFKSAIQGHFAIQEEKDGKLKRSMMASRHYADYEIADRVIAQYNGRRKGIKLGLQGIEPIEMFKESYAHQPAPPGAVRQSTSLRLWRDDKPRLDAIIDRLDIDTDLNQQNRLHAFIQWAESQVERQQQAGGTESLPQELEPVLPVAVEEPLSTDADSQPELLMDSTAAHPTQTDTAHEPSSRRSDDDLKETISELTDVMKSFLQWQMSNAQPILPAVQPAPVPSPVPQATHYTPVPTPQQATKSIPAPPSPAIVPPSAALSSSYPESTQQVKSDRMGRPVSAHNDAILNAVIDAIIAHNNQPDLPHDLKWAITLGILREYVISQSAVYRVLRSREAEITQHHALHQIDSEKHNNRHRRKRKIKDVIPMPTTHSSLDETSPNKISIP